MREKMKKYLLLLVMSFSTPAWAETIVLLQGGKENTYEVRKKLICDPISEVVVKMDDIDIDALSLGKDALKASSSTILTFLENGDLVIERDYFDRLEGREDSINGFFHWGSLNQVEIKTTDNLGILMIQNQRNSSWATGRYVIWTTHNWFRCINE